MLVAVAVLVVPSVLMYVSQWVHARSFCLNDPTCSQAIATWELVLFAILTFMAAAYAATFARRSYKIEVKAALSQRACAAPDKPDVSVAINASRNVDRFFGPVELPGLARSEFHAFTNLGRSPLVGVEVKCRLEFPQAGGTAAVEKILSIGSLPDRGNVTMQILSDVALGEIRAVWLSATHLRLGKRKKLEFHPAERAAETVPVPTAPIAPAL